MYLPELQECWQCGGDRTIDIEVCPLCEHNLTHPDCRLAIPVEKTISCPICCESDDNEQEEFSYAE